MWAEDNPALVLSELTLQETGIEWRERKAALLTKSLKKLPIPELKKVGHDHAHLSCQLPVRSIFWREIFPCFWQRVFRVRGDAPCFLPCKRRPGFSKRPSGGANLHEGRRFLSLKSVSRDCQRSAQKVLVEGRVLAITRTPSPFRRGHQYL